MVGCRITGPGAGLVIKAENHNRDKRPQVAMQH